MSEHSIHEICQTIQICFAFIVLAVVIYRR